MQPIADLIAGADEARRNHDPAEAERLLMDALLMARGGESPDLARVLARLGQIERDLGQLAKARQFYGEAVELYRNAGDPLRLASAIRHLADVHRHEGDLAHAGDCYEEALSIYRAREETSPLELANALRPLAILRQSTGDRDTARQLWLEARGLYQEAGIEAGVAECAEQLGDLG